jgi:acyl carrier protein
MTEATAIPVHVVIRQFVMENFLYMRPDYQFSDDDALIGRGIVDSLGVMELITFVEETFAVHVADEDVTEEHLGSISAIARYVARARAAH